MLPTFVIGLREGLEAALIVGFVAAFLKRAGRSDLLRWVFLGVALAIVLCAGVGVGLRLYAETLPQRQQEALETVIGAVAVGMVTYMVVWMRRNSRSLKGSLEGAAADALKAGSGMALVAMAFLAVLREGIETVVFLLAAFQESSSGAGAGWGALIGILVAVGLGYGIYRGGVRINLSKFFRVTGFVLVLVAAGLVVNALHTAHEAGWLNAGQQQVLNLSAAVTPGSVQASLITGMLGIQPRPVLAEVIGWLVYLVPVGLYIVWPPGRGLQRAARIRLATAAAALAGVAAVLLAVLAPGATSPGPTRSGALSAQLVSSDAGAAHFAVAGPDGVARAVAATASATASRGELSTTTWTGTLPGGPASSRTLSAAQLAGLSGGRLPIGVRGNGPFTLTTTSTTTVTLEVAGNRVIDANFVTAADEVARTPDGASFPITGAADRTVAFAPADVSTAVAAAQRDEAATDRAALMHGLAWTLGGVAVALVLVAGADTWSGRRDRRIAPVAAEGARTPVHV